MKRRPAAKAPRRLRSVARPKQARSERTLYRILDVAETLIERRGLGDVSIPEIVRRAGSSVGGFYARFRDKNELLHALEERFFEELLDRLDALADTERWRDADVDTVVAACLAELMRTARERRNLLAAFLARAAQDPEARAEALRFRGEATQLMLPLFRSMGAASAHPDPPTAIAVAVQVAFALVQQRLLADADAAGELDDAALQRELHRLLVPYLGFESRRSARSRTG